MRKAAPESRCDLLLYTHSFDGGGAERVMVQLANTWTGVGARVTLVVNRAEGPLRRLVRDDVAVRGLARKRGLLAAPALAATIREIGPVAVVSAMTEQNITTCVTRRLAGFRGPVLTVEHTFMTGALAEMSAGRRRLLRTLMRLSYPLADRVSSVSEAAARDLEAVAGLRHGTVATLYNPIWPLHPSGATAANVHPWLAEPDPVLLTVGRLVEAKNHRNLLEALAIARRRRPVRLILLGEGPLRADLEAAATALGIREAVDFAGYRTDVADFLRHADLFVLSSDREGLPLSLMESMSLGTPVVATDCRSGPRELLADGRYGDLVPVRDAGALASAMLAALAAPSDSASLKARAAEFVPAEIIGAYERVLFSDAPAPWRQRPAA